VRRPIPRYPLPVPRATGEVADQATEGSTMIALPGDLRPQRGSTWCVPAVVEALALLAGREVRQEDMVLEYFKQYPTDGPPNPDRNTLQATAESYPLRNSNFLLFKDIAEGLLGTKGLMSHVGGLTSDTYRSAVEATVGGGKPVAVSVVVHGGWHMLVSSAATLRVSLRGTLELGRPERQPGVRRSSQATSWPLHEHARCYGMSSGSIVRPHERWGQRVGEIHLEWGD
jgi:hypothetical protein